MEHESSQSWTQPPNGHYRPDHPPEHWDDEDPSLQRAPAPEEQREEEKPRAKRTWRKRVGLVVLALAILAAIAWGIRAYVYGRHHASTDDATIQGHVSPVIPRVDGYVAKVLVDDNQIVKEGQLLAVIDSTPQRLAVQRAEAEVASAKAAAQSAAAQVANADAARRAAAAQVEVGKVALAEANREARRQQRLLKSHATPPKTYDNARSAADEARAKLRALTQQVAVATAAVGQAKAAQARAQAALEQSQAALADKKLQQGYTELRAPIAGRVSQKTLEPGEYVRAGGPVMAIADERDSWIVANFKEGDIAGIRPGQPVKIDVDAYSGRDFHGKVDSIAGATGSEFALLPEQSANSNFVKVEKRIPVKIVFTDPADPNVPLRPGMNVEVAVTTGS